MVPITLAPARIARRISGESSLRTASGSATAVLASYPKSGRTWVRFILAHYFAAVARNPAVDTETMFAFAPNYDLDPVRGIPAFLRRAEATAVPLIPSTHAPFSGRMPPDLPVVFVVRDPRDVMTSAYHHVTRHKHSFTGDIDAFLADERQGLPKYIRYMNGWAAGLRRRPHFVLTYEGLVADTAGEMGRVLQFLDIPLDRGALAEAVECSSFGNLRALEQAKGMPGHDYDLSDPDALRMRRGKVGSFRDELSPAQAQWIERTCASGLGQPAASLLSSYGMALKGQGDRRDSFAAIRPIPKAKDAAPRRTSLGIQILAELMVLIGLAAALLAPAILAIEVGEWWLQREWDGHSLEDGLSLFGINRAGPVETATERIVDVLLALPLTITLFICGILTLLTGVQLGDWGVQGVKLKKKLTLAGP